MLTFLRICNSFVRLSWDNIIYFCEMENCVGMQYFGEITQIFFVICVCVCVCGGVHMYLGNAKILRVKFLKET